MFKQVTLILAMLALSTRAEDIFSIRLMIGPNVWMNGFGGKKYVGPAQVDPFSAPATFQAVTFQPHITIIGGGEVTFNCELTRNEGATMVDDRVMIIQAVEPYWPLTNNGAVHLDCKLGGT